MPSPEEAETVEETLDPPGIEEEPMPLVSGKIYKFTIQKRKTAHLLEVEDAHFHHDSAVMMPDYTGHVDPYAPREDDPHRLTGLSVIRAALIHAEDHSSQKLMVAGHTDTTGSPSYNYTLSEQRATNVISMLKGDKEKWVEVADEKHQVEDYQQILTWIDNLFGYDCNPQGIDNQSGPKTRAAIEAFQDSYNTDFEESITVDGLIGPQTWGAIFDCYQKALAEIMLETDAAGLSQKQGALSFLTPEFVGCGESKPIEGKGKNNYASETNRRVEILFFDPGEEPDLAGTCHPSGGCNPDMCKLFDDACYSRKHLGALPVPGTAQSVTLHLVDETGEPLKETDITLKFDNGAQSTLTTNDKGKIMVALVQDVDFVIELTDAQEAAAGHGVATRSGTHLPPDAP